MAEDSPYKVEYIDQTPEECTYIKRAGKVRISYPNGDTYTGEVNAQKQKHGMGHYTWKRSESVPVEGTEEDDVKPLASYEGSYREGERDGVGKMVFPNHDVYHGEWRKNQIEGEGAYMYQNGDLYSGRFHKGKKQSDETSEAPEGGENSKGPKGGTVGTYEYGKDKSKLIGRWENGEFEGGKWAMSSYQAYHGAFAHGQPIGKGRIETGNGLLEEGEYLIKAEEPYEVMWKAELVREVKQ